MTSWRIFIFVMLLGIKAQSFDNYSLPNCTTVPETSISSAFIYWSTVTQTFLSVVQLIGGPANFIADRIFYDKHNSPRVKQEGRLLAQERDRQKKLKKEGYGLVCQKIHGIISAIKIDASASMNDEEAVKALNIIGQWLDTVADNHDPIAEEALAE